MQILLLKLFRETVHQVLRIDEEIFFVHNKRDFISNFLIHHSKTKYLALTVNIDERST